MTVDLLAYSASETNVERGERNSMEKEVASQVAVTAPNPNFLSARRSGDRHLLARAIFQQTAVLNYRIYRTILVSLYCVIKAFK